MYQFVTALLLILNFVGDCNAFAATVIKPGVFKPQAAIPTTPVAPAAVAATSPTAPAVVSPEQLTKAPVSLGQSAPTQTPQSGQVNPSDMIRQLTQIGGNPSGSGGNGSPGRGSTQLLNAGDMEDCGSLNGSVTKALEETKAYRGSCRLANLGAEQNIAINDYSQSPPYMYLFDSNYKCLKKTAVTYGNGAGQGEPQACDSNGNHLTPAGFHLTAPHDGEVYNHTNSLLLVGLEGQGSAVRNILIHGAAQPGTPSSWGCSGVGKACLQTVMEFLKTGGLVYNYFGDKAPAAGCGKTEGTGHQHSTCQLDPGGGGAVSGGSSGSSQRGQSGAGH